MWECLELSGAGVKTPRGLDPAPPLDARPLIDVGHPPIISLKVRDPGPHVPDLEDDEGSPEDDEEGHEAHHTEADDPEHQRDVLSDQNVILGVLVTTGHLFNGGGLYLHHYSVVLLR